MKRKSILLLALLAVLLLATGTTELLAQCPMCRATAESNLANGGSTGKGLNAGILYMLATPYLLLGVLVWLWRKNRNKEADEQVA